MTFNVPLMAPEEMRIKSGPSDQEVYVLMQHFGRQAEPQDCSLCSCGCFRVTDNVLLARSSVSWDICHPSFLISFLLENVDPHWDYPHHSSHEECDPSLHPQRNFRSISGSALQYFAVQKCCCLSVSEHNSTFLPFHPENPFRLVKSAYDKWC